MCARYEIVLNTQRLSFPSTTVAIRNTISQRQSQSIKNVCAAQADSRDLNHCGLKTNAEVLTYKHCCGCNWRKRVQEEESRLCGVSISKYFSHNFPLGSHMLRLPSSLMSSTFFKKNSSDFRCSPSWCVFPIVFEKNFCQLSVPPQSCQRAMVQVSFEENHWFFHRVRLFGSLAWWPS